MLLVADSGSTKADWSYYDQDGELATVTSIGINPNLHSDAEMRTVIQSAIPANVHEAKVKWVYYYGTGVWDTKRAQRIQKLLTATYPNASVEIHHDLLGAARAACKDKPGIACILGTGSNSCLYNGNKVVDNVTNLGWLLGDEGSGVDLGKRLIRAYSYRELSLENRQHFEDSTGHNKQSIGDGLYGDGSTNRFLASFSPYIHDNLHRPAIRQLVVDSFVEFIRCHVKKYDGYEQLPVSFIGSIAYHYAEILKTVCATEGLTCGDIEQKPILALVKFHCDQHDLPA